MRLRDSWHRALIFSGLVEDGPRPCPDHLVAAEPSPALAAAALAIPRLVASGAEAWRPAAPTAPTAPTATEDPTSDYRADDVEQIVVRRLPSQVPSPPAPPHDEIEEIFAGKEAAESPLAPPRPTAAARPPPPTTAPPGTAAPPPTTAPAHAPAPRPAPASMHDPRHASAAGPAPAGGLELSVLRVAPRSFNDAQAVADRFKAFGPVILDMKGVDTDLAKRLIGFASGLTYGLDGAMDRLDDRVFLLTPRGVELPATQRSRLAAQGSLHRV